MDSLLEAIRSGVANDATAEQKAAGVQACRTILVALDTEPGKAFALSGTPPQSPLVGMSIDNVLDLVIAQLTTIASARDAVTALPLAPAATGLRVPAAVALPGRTAQPTNARPAKAPQIVHKPRAQSPAHPAPPIGHEPRAQSPAKRPAPTRKS